MNSCPDGVDCVNFSDGHRTHHIRARRAGETPWGWRDAVTVSVSGGRAELRYVREDVAVGIEHHRALPVSPGVPVRVHEEYRLLAASGAWYCVAVDGGLGAVPPPDSQYPWAAETSASIIDLSAGNALPTGREV